MCVLVGNKATITAVTPAHMRRFSKSWSYHEATRLDATSHAIVTN